MNKLDLIQLAKRKGFESNFIYNSVYRFSDKEQDRWYLWLCEMQKQIEHDTNIAIGILPGYYNGGVMFEIEIWSGGFDTTIDNKFNSREEALYKGVEIALNELEDK